MAGRYGTLGKKFSLKLTPKENRSIVFRKNAVFLYTLQLSEDRLDYIGTKKEKQKKLDFLGKKMADVRRVVKPITSLSDTTFYNSLSRESQQHSINTDQLH